jgi:hypothetical protein
MASVTHPPIPRKVRVIFETRSGDHRTRRVEVSAHPGDTPAVLMSKASDEYRRRYGFATRVVSILLS